VAAEQNFPDFEFDYTDPASYARFAAHLEEVVLAPKIPVGAGAAPCRALAHAGARLGHPRHPPHRRSSLPVMVGCSACSLSRWRAGGGGVW
jgi:hypothetical protein